ncbi:hypothetical protein B0A55_00753 [Friedmanniomyces simplex]|uniref:Transcription factor Iwr1 domain-containing protein n=1 Tax=Friedmanniomyces simplex TaxID=329884 RepID=A0A4U0Y3C5_9PEZI|nr:hypothetical protein B0A55_00753 [Friedmanniomyces simplex]
MSTGPSQVCVKRKRNDPAPDRLIVESESEPQRKKVLTVQDAEATRKLQYVRVPREEQAGDVRDVSGEAGGREKQQGSLETGGQGTKRLSGGGGGGGRRVFRLRRPDGGVGAEREGRREVGSAERGGVATFVEARGDQGSREATGAQTSVSTDPATLAPGRQLKRPGRGAAVPARAQGAEAAQDRKRLESVADNLHQFALDELANAPKQRVTTLPKFAGRRRNMERKATEPRIRDDEDVDMDSDGDYVYDTYVLAPSDGAAPPDISISNELSDIEIGYLIITDEDQSVWETYIEDEPSDQDCDTDDEDENAEDYYGADYPEDEMASDDEGGRNAYGYRANGASDGEEWDEDTGAYIDDGEYERTMNPWKAKTPREFVAHQDLADAGDE